jgi:hypothetical protein
MAARLLATLALGSAIGASALAIAVAPGRPQAPLGTSLAARCPGTFRWPVKTMTDAASRGRWASARPKATTIRALVHRTGRPRRLTGSTPRQPGAERTIFRVRARLVAARAGDSASGDGDIRLVAADPTTGETMVVAFPDPNCAPASHSPKREQMTLARVSFIARCQFPPLGRYASLRGSATITGVGYWAAKGSGRGVAANGIELHPVLGFTGPGCVR